MPGGAPYLASAIDVPVDAAGEAGSTPRADRAPPAGELLAPRPGRGAAAAVAVIVALSAFVHWLASLGHVVPYYFADEYIYSALARGIADHGAPDVRGSTAAFPAVLEPLQTSIFYVFFGIEDAFRLTQALHAIEMSLAAVPVYLLARRLRLGASPALACAALAVVSPALFWSSFILADPVAYTLALTALYAAVRVLEEPRLQTQIAFFGAAALATAARTQYIVLFLALPVAAWIVEQGNLRRVVRGQWLTVGALGVAMIATAAVGFAGVLGPYTAWFGVATDPAVVARSVALDALVVVLAAGAVVVPGAIVGLDLLLSHPRTRAERGFAAMSLLFGAALAGLATLGTTTRVQERYLIALIPLPALICAVWVDRGMPRRRIAAALAVSLAAVYAVVDLTGWGTAHSPTLRGLGQLEQALGDPALVRVAVVLLMLLAVLLIGLRRGRALLLVAIAVSGALSVGAYVSDRENALEVREGRLPANKDWLDRTGIGEAAVLHAPGAERAPALQQLFWNRSLDRVLELDGADPLDFFATEHARISRDGRLLVADRPVRSPLLVPWQGAAFTFEGVRLVRRLRDFELVRPGGSARIATMISGRFRDGWIGSRATIRAWPGLVGSGPRELTFTVSLPATRPQAVQLRLSGAGPPRELLIRPGTQVPITFPMSGSTPLRVVLEATPTFEIGSRIVALRVLRPRLRAQRP